MYENFFGLRERPFDLLPNPRFLFLAGRHREAFSTLRYGLSVPQGLTLLVGEAGTGKTTLVQSALASLDANHVECVQMSNPTLTRSEFYEFLAGGFGLGPEAVASKTRFLTDLRTHLEARQARGQLSALVLDEAQSVPYELLEEVRLLSNMETTTAKLLNVVLTGQPELSARLNESSLRQLKQRISLRCEIRPLGLQESATYIAGRLRIAGGEPAQIFTRDAICRVHEVSGGIPRTINVLCDNALLEGYSAQMKPISRSAVERVCRDFDFGVSSQKKASHAEPRDSEEQVPTADRRPALREAVVAGAAPKSRFSFFLRDGQNAKA